MGDVAGAYKMGNLQKNYILQCNTNNTNSDKIRICMAEWI